MSIVHDGIRFDLPNETVLQKKNVIYHRIKSDTDMHTKRYCSSDTEISAKKSLNYP